MNIELPHGGQLKITGNVIEIMFSFSQLSRQDLEAGGMLIGHHPIGSDNIILDRLTTPQPADRRSRNHFHRDQAAHQHLLDMQWQLSGETRTYVGEWHSHPEARPRPSCTDRKSWTKAVKETKFHGPGLIFIIVGTQMTRVWFRALGFKSHVRLLEIPNRVCHENARSIDGS